MMASSVKEAVAASCACASVRLCRRLMTIDESMIGLFRVLLLGRHLLCPDLRERLLLYHLNALLNVGGVLSLKLCLFCCSYCAAIETLHGIEDVFPMFNCVVPIFVVSILLVVFPDILFVK